MSDNIRLAEYADRLTKARDEALARSRRFTATSDYHKGQVEAFNASLHLLHLWTDGQYGEDAPGQPAESGEESGATEHEGSSEWHSLRHSDQGQHHECTHAACIEYIRREIHNPAHINRDGKFYGPDECDWDACIDYRESLARRPTASRG